MLNNKGISLVELMVSIAIMTFLMAAVQTTLLTAQNSLNYSNTNGQLQQSNNGLFLQYVFSSTGHLSELPLNLFLDVIFISIAESS